MRLTLCRQICGDRLVAVHEDESRSGRAGLREQLGEQRDRSCTFGTWLDEGDVAEREGARDAREDFAGWVQWADIIDESSTDRLTTDVAVAVSSSRQIEMTP